MNAKLLITHDNNVGISENGEVHSYGGRIERIL